MVSRAKGIPDVHTNTTHRYFNQRWSIIQRTAGQGVVYGESPNLWKSWIISDAKWDSSVGSWGVVPCVLSWYAASPTTFVLHKLPITYVEL